MVQTNQNQTIWHMEIPGDLMIGDFASTQSRERGSLALRREKQYQAWHTFRWLLCTSATVNWLGWTLVFQLLCNNTEHTTLWNALHFFSLTHETKKKTWHNSVFLSLSATVTWIFSCNWKCFWKKMYFEHCLWVEAQQQNSFFTSSFGDFWQGKIRCGACSWEGSACLPQLLCTSPAEQHYAYRWVWGWPKEMDCRDAYLFTFPDSKAKSHHCL